MKITCLPVALVMLALSCSPSRSEASQEMSILLKPWKEQPRQDSRGGVHLWIVLRDISSHPIAINENEDRNSAESNYILNVLNMDGVQAQLTEYGQRIYGGNEIFVAGTYRMTTLQPGQSITTSVRADKVYDMSQPGTYTVSVSRKIDDRSGPHYIQSNEVTVTVTP